MDQEISTILPDLKENPLRYHNGGGNVEIMKKIKSQDSNTNILLLFGHSKFFYLLNDAVKIARELYSLKN